MADDIEEELEQAKKLPPKERVQKLKDIAEREEKRLEAEREPVEAPPPEETAELTTVVSGEEGLEEITEVAPQQSEGGEEARAVYFSQVPYEVIYDTATRLASQHSQQGYLNEAQQFDLYLAAQEANKRIEAIERGTYKPVGEQVANQLGKIKTLWEKIQSYEQ